MYKRQLYILVHDVIIADEGLEVEVQTKNDGERTRIEVVVETVEHLRVDAVVVGDGEHIGSRGIGAA